MKNYFILLIGIIFNSCVLEKEIELIPIEPFVLYENDIKFSISSKWKPNIHFQTRYYESPGIFINTQIETNQNIENVYLKTISINIKELDFCFNKENIMIPLPNEADRPNRIFPAKYLYEHNIFRYLIDTNEILNEYNPNITLNKFYSKFNKAKEIEYHLILIYDIDNQNYETKLIWKYEYMQKKYFGFWRSLMSI